ncbi:MAG: hypothetical protein V1887_03095 [Candidatus Aenigmatarchaeota archaeon]
MAEKSKIPVGERLAFRFEQGLLKRGYQLRYPSDGEAWSYAYAKEGECMVVRIADPDQFVYTGRKVNVKFPKKDGGEFVLTRPYGSGWTGCDADVMADIAAIMMQTAAKGL